MPNIVEGPVDVPDVVGLDQSTAEAALNNVFLNAVDGGAVSSSAYGVGLVLSQSPVAGAQVDPNTAPDVTLTFSLGPPLYLFRRVHQFINDFVSQS